MLEHCTWGEFKEEPACVCVVDRLDEGRVHELCVGMSALNPHV